MSNSIIESFRAKVWLYALLVFGLAGSASADQQLMIQQLAAKYNLKSSHIAFEFVPTDKKSADSFVFAHNNKLPFRPASTVKLVTSVVSLQQLGPDFRFATEFYLDNLPESGELAGNLYVRGLADPSMVSEQLWRTASDLYNRGVRKIRGNLVGDVSFLDTRSLNQQFSKNMASNHSLSPLSLNYGHIQVWIEPARPGQLARVRTDPQLPGYIEFQNEVTTSSGRKHRLSAKLQSAGDKLKVVTSGSIGANAEPVQLYRPVPNPNRYFLAALHSIFTQLGGKIEGAAVIGTIPVTASLFYRKESELFLSQIVILLNKYSNNFIADQLVAAIGNSLGQKGDPFANGINFINQFVAKRGSANHQIVNGSGLSRATRLSPAALNQVVLTGLNDPKISAELLASMRLFGGGKEDVSRPGLSSLSSFVRAKTGTLRDSVSLSGVVYPSRSEDKSLVFSIMVNKENIQRDKMSYLQADIINRALESWQLHNSRVKY